MEPLTLYPDDFALVFKDDRLCEVKLLDSGMQKLKAAGYDRVMEVDLSIGEHDDGTFTVTVRPRAND